MISINFLSSSCLLFSSKLSTQIYFLISLSPLFPIYSLFPPSIRSHFLDSSLFPNWKKIPLLNFIQLPFGQVEFRLFKCNNNYIRTQNILLFFYHVIFFHFINLIIQHQLVFDADEKKHSETISITSIFCAQFFVLLLHCFTLAIGVQKIIFIGECNYFSKVV